jgi:N-acetylmuramoyl-L-alanine amidase
MQPRRLGTLVAWCALGLAIAPGSAPARPFAHAASAAVSTARTFHSARAVTHLAVHWRGHRTAFVQVAMSRDGRHFGRRRAVALDDAARPSRETWGAVMTAYGVRAVRVYTDRPLPRLTVLWLKDRGGPPRATAIAAATVSQPQVIPRVDWGADESLRYDSAGNEIWPPAYYPVQKLIVHHTDTQNDDPNPAATVRSIYYYHAVTQGWGDIGYNFLIDEQGRIYEGRHTIDYPSGSSPTGQDASGRGVTGAHAQGFNSGTVGIALLGTLTNQDATPAARQALEQLLAWEAGDHGIDPQGSSLYTNPVNGTQKTFANIAGHRDVNATECPGGVFYATLPAIRSDVANLLSTQSTPDFSLSVSPSSRSIKRGSKTTYSISIAPSGGFTGSVSLSASGLPAQAGASFSPNPATGSSTMTVTTSRSTPVGTFTLRIDGTSASLTRTTTATLVTRK